MEEKLLTQKEVIDIVGISRTTLFRLIKEGLPYVETPSGKKLFREDEVRNFVQTRRENLTDELIIGKEYTNSEIVEMFKVGVMGGMRQSHSRNVLVLISLHDGNPSIYHDYWKDDVLYYTVAYKNSGEPFSGASKILAESNRNGVNLYLFEVFYSSRYQYRGIVKLVGEPFVEKERDADGEERCMWKFPLKLINEKDVMEMELVDEAEAHLHKQVIKNMASTLTLVASASKMVLSGSERTVKTRRVQFNPVISEYVHMRARGCCELCGCEAPFEYQGRPYLELHHIVPFSEGGKDAANNIAAICPNCHALVTKLAKPEDAQKLKVNIEKNEQMLRKSLDGESD